MRRYSRYMTPTDKLAYPGLSDVGLETQVTKDYHRVEKGLALQDPKRPFGAEVARRLETLIPALPADRAVVEHAATALAALNQWNAEGTVDDRVSPVNVHSDRTIDDPEGFFLTRHSVRDFSDDDVPYVVLERAVSLALSTPSVCNRQAWRVRFLRGAEASSARKFQSGNAGITRIPVLAIVSTDLRFFTGPAERNQAWVDGGLFSMNLVMALHALGVDSCMLNMSVTNERADQLRMHVGISSAEVVIMMIAIGYGRQGHRVARSPRRGLDSVIKAKL